MLIVSTFISNTSFTVAGDRTGAFAVGVRVQADCDMDGTRYGTVTASSYASGSDLTMVTLSLDSGSLTANLTGVLHGNDIPASLVNHGHGNQADGGELSDFIRRDNSRAFTQGFISGVGAYTGFKFTETGADVASNAGKWIFQVDEGMFSLLTVDDAESAFHSALTINRDGATPSDVTIAAPYIGLSADDVEASGNIVPPASDPGSLGTASRPWADVRTGKLLGLDVSGGTVDALVTKASAAEAVTGTDTAKAITPATARQAVLSLVRDSLGKFPGIIPPSLNLFCGDATSDTAPAGTFTRSTTGTRLGQTGLIETVAAGSVRREWGTGERRGWTIESTATNLLTYSEQFDNAAWTKTGMTTSANATTAPDGNTTADKIVEDTSTFHKIQTQASATLNVVNSFSLFIRTAERSKLRLYIFNGSATSNFIRGFFDLTTKSATKDSAGNGSATSAQIEEMGFGWYRLSLSGIIDSAVSSGTALAQIRMTDASGNESYAGDGTSGFYVWGAQLESGPFPTSYISTTSSAVARSADVWTIPLTTSWFNTATGTIFVAGRTANGVPTTGSLQYLTVFNDESSNNSISISRNTSKQVHCIVTASGTLVADINLGVVANATIFRMAFSWSLSRFSASLNGGTCVTATAATFPTSLTVHNIGSGIFGGSQWGGHVLHDVSFPVALSDTQLQAITL